MPPHPTDAQNAEDQPASDASRLSRLSVRPDHSLLGAEWPHSGSKRAANLLEAGSHRAIERRHESVRSRTDRAIGRVVTEGASRSFRPATPEVTGFESRRSRY